MSDALLELLRARSELLNSVRRYFAGQGVLEVETPLRYPSTSSEPGLASFEVDPGYFLQTSPEFPMKRLLAAGSGPIFQVCKAFRAGEAGSRHNPEFSMLEWYRPGFSLAQLMDEIRALVSAALGHAVPTQQASYRDCFSRSTGLNPDRALDAELIQLAGEALGFTGELDRTGLLDLLFSGLVEPAMPPERLTFVTDYPVELAELAATGVDADGHTRAMRFEAFLGGMELANGCVELADRDEFSRRWNLNNEHRKQAGLVEIPGDCGLVEALDRLPPVAGAALGIDRLLMCRLGESRIEDVLAFPESVLSRNASTQLRT